jgi:helix-turn-helix protein
VLFLDAEALAASSMTFYQAFDFWYALTASGVVFQWLRPVAHAAVPLARFFNPLSGKVAYAVLFPGTDLCLIMSDERLLTIEEVAERLQYSVEWVRDRVNEGIIPCIRFNARAWRFHWPSVLSALQK